MLRKFLPRQERFFDLFQKTADILVLATQQFSSMLQDLKNTSVHVTAIAAYEKQGDELAHATFELLHKTFITPFDRHDIHQLTSGLDDILDKINRCSQRFPFYQLASVPQEIAILADLTSQAAILLRDAISYLDLLKHSDKILNACEKISQLEGEADSILLTGMAKLFQEVADFKEFVRVKEVYEYTKSVIDSCEDVANIIKGIVLEYS